MTRHRNPKPPAGRPPQGGRGRNNPGSGGQQGNNARGTVVEMACALLNGASSSSEQWWLSCQNPAIVAFPPEFAIPSGQRIPDFDFCTRIFTYDLKTFVLKTPIQGGNQQKVDLSWDQLVQYVKQLETAVFPGEQVARSTRVSVGDFAVGFGDTSTTQNISPLLSERLAINFRFLS